MEYEIPTCPICWETFNLHDRHPRVSTRCGHSFCFRCLLAMTRSVPNPQILSCPVCRRTMQLIPRNHTLIQLISHLENMNLRQN